MLSTAGFGRAAPHENGTWDFGRLVAGLPATSRVPFQKEDPVRLSSCLTVACVMCLALSASAHHSHGQYEETFRDIEGVVKELHLLTPHSWLYIEVKDAAGAAQVWALEATTRGQLEKMGVTREYVKAGDRVKARCHPLRDRTNGCLLGFLKAGDGSVKDWDGGNAPAPKDF